MANRIGNDDRGFGGGTGGADRERQRDVVSEPARSQGAPVVGAPVGSNSSVSSNGGRKSARGFASMDASKQKEIASKGGRAAHAKGTAHEFDSNEARAAGRKGGMAVSRNREHMAAIGRRGGEARGQRARQLAQSGASQRSNEPLRQNTQGSGVASSTRGLGADKEVGISGSSLGATQNTRGSENALGGERRQPSQPAGGVEGTRGEDRA